MPGGPIDLKMYGIAVALVVTAAVLRYVLGIVEDDVLLFAIFFPVIIFAALWCGVGPAIFASVLVLIIVWYAFIPPHFTFAIKDHGNVLNLLLYAFCAGLVIWIGAGYKRAMAATAAAEERRNMLVDELRHRSRNSMSVASTIISRTLSDQPHVAEQLIARLRVLLGSEDILSASDAVERDIERVISAKLKPYGADKFALIGEPVTITPRQARNLALIVHELATNSLKYGALSVASGFLTVTWRREGGQIVIDWTEEGRNSAGYQEGPSGFGTKLIDVMIRDLNGHIDRRPTDTGFVCRMDLPTKDRAAAPTEQAAAAAPGL